MAFIGVGDHGAESSGLADAGNPCAIWSYIGLMQPPPPPAPQAPSAPSPPLAPVAPTAPDVGLGPAVPAIAGAPIAARAALRTGAELAALREQRKWLSDQLVSAQERRRDVARALERAHDPVNQNGLQQRLQMLDRRILQLESDIAESGRLITTAPAAVVAAAEAPRIPFGDFNRGPSGSVVAIVFIVSVFLPLAIALANILVRRTRRAAPDRALQESAARLVRLEQAVDAIAVEVERVSEGQRFVTRLLAEPRTPAEATPALNQYRPD